MTVYCPVAGCPQVFISKGQWFEEHAAKPHVRCECGWVGTSVVKHISQRKRWGLSLEKCQRGSLITT